MIKRLWLLCLSLLLVGCNVNNDNSNSISSDISSSVSVSSEQVADNVYRGVSWFINVNNGSLDIYWTNKDRSIEFTKTYKSGNYQIIYRKFESWLDYENYLFDYGKTCLLILTINNVSIY